MKWALVPIGAEKIEHRADHIDFESIVIPELRGIRTDENLNAIVSRNRAVPLCHFCGDILVLTVKAHIQVLFIPEQFGNSLLLGSVLPPVEMEIFCGRSLPPPGLVQLAVNLDGRGRPKNIVARLRL
jgi:hypothetical protein